MTNQTFSSRILLGGLFLLATSVATAQDANLHPCGTRLLHRELGVPLMAPRLSAPEGVNLPQSLDWGPLARNPLGRNIMTPVRDQKSCGSCWAFAVVGVMEGWVNGLFDMPSIDLSEQALVSDSCPAGDCGGGYLSMAANWMADEGMTRESSWPYIGTNSPGRNGPIDDVFVGTQTWDYACGSWAVIDINLIKQALVEHGPLVTAFDVYEDFDSYSGGIYRHQSGYYRGGHAVVITGYVDTDDAPGGGFFVVKNSWGANWGPYGGYFLVAYDSNCVTSSLLVTTTPPHPLPPYFNQFFSIVLLSLNRVRYGQSQTTLMRKCRDCNHAATQRDLA